MGLCCVRYRTYRPAHLHAQCHVCHACARHASVCKRCCVASLDQIAVLHVFLLRLVVVGRQVAPVRHPLVGTPRLDVRCRTLVWLGSCRSHVELCLRALLTHRSFGWDPLSPAEGLAMLMLGRCGLVMTLGSLVVDLKTVVS